MSNELKEKPLLCLDKTKVQEADETYQFLKWTAFRESYFISIEKSKKSITLVKKKIYTSSYNQKTGEYIDKRFDILKTKKLSLAEFKNFKLLLDKYNFWEHDKYDVAPLCNDGWGVRVSALKKDHFLNIDNGNCSPPNEYLNSLYSELVEQYDL